MDCVAGTRFESTLAYLPGFFRKQVINAVYPAIAPGSDHQVEGVLYLNVSKQALKRLDHYEGDLYERSAVIIQLANGHWLDAHSYVIKPDYQSMMSDQDWHLENFNEHHHTQFKQEYEGFQHLDTL